MNEIYEVMKKYGEMISSQGYPIGQTKMMIETPKGVFATRDDADIGELREEDIEKLGIEKLPIPEAEMKAVVYSQTPCCQKALREARPFKACLDDMAQVFGHTAYIADGRDGNASMGKSIGKALRGNAGCLILRGTDKKGKGTGYTLTMGRSLYEATVAMTVLEKSAEISFLAEKIGGGKPIAKWEARLMRYVYEKKYSKAEERVKMAETGQGTKEMADAGSHIREQEAAPCEQRLERTSNAVRTKAGGDGSGTGDLGKSVCKTGRKIYACHPLGPRLYETWRRRYGKGRYKIAGV